MTTTDTASGTIYFPLAEVASLAEDVLASPVHVSSWLDTEQGRETGPALMWVKDDGTYLIHNGTHPATGPVVVYGAASPDGPRLDGDQWDLTRDICGGDDFAEYLPLADTPLVRPDVVAAALRDGYRWLVFEVQGESFTLEVSR